MADTFTPEQVTQILEEFFKVVGTRQYIGARYVPIFGRKGEESIQWDNSAPYEPLTIVLHQGNSFTSRQYVPAGVDITNATYWASTGVYNAQIEQYRQEVLQFGDRITNTENAITNLDTTLTNKIDTLDTTLTDKIDTLDTKLTGDISDLNTSLSGEIDALDTKLTGDISNVNTSLSGEIDALDTKLTGDISNVGTSLSELDTRVTDAIAQLETTISRNNVYYGTKSIGFGDSNMAGGEAGATENVYYRICQMLGCEYDNRGINGATIQTTGDDKDILPSIQAAEPDPEVRLVVLIGGINDYHYVDYNFTNFSNAARTCVNEILTKFVNADVVVIWDQGKQHPNARMLRYQDALNGCTTASRTRKVMSVPTYDLSFYANWYTSQNHWNGNGCGVVAQRACAYLLGGMPFPALTYRVSVSPESGVSNCGAVVQKIAHLDVVAIDQYADIHFSENFAASAYTVLFNLPLGIDGRLGSGDTYFDVGYPINDGKAARFNIRQWQTNYESVTESPTLVVRNRNAIAAADIANEFDIRLSIPLRPQQ